MQLSAVSTSATVSIPWAASFALSTFVSSTWLDVDMYQIMPSPFIMGSSLAPMLLCIWQLWMLVSVAFGVVAMCCAPRDTDAYDGVGFHLLCDMPDSSHSICRGASSPSLLYSRFLHCLNKNVILLQIACLPFSRGGVDGSLGSVWRSLKQVRRHLTRKPPEVDALIHTCMFVHCSKVFCFDVGLHKCLQTGVLFTFQLLGSSGAWMCILAAYASSAPIAQQLSGPSLC